MKKFKQFINETVMDYLKPKSEEDIDKAIANMNIIDRNKLVDKEELPKKYKPTEKELIDNIDQVEEFVKEKMIQLDFKFDDLIGGINDEDYDYIIDGIKKIKEKNINNIISTEEIVFSESLLYILKFIAKSDHVTGDSYHMPFDHRRLVFLKNMIRMVGGKKIFQLLKKRRKK